MVVPHTIVEGRQLRSLESMKQKKVAIFSPALNKEDKIRPLTDKKKRKKINKSHWNWLTPDGVDFISTTLWTSGIQCRTVRSKRS